MLAFNGDYWREGWFIAKLLLVVALSGYHGWLIGYFKKLKKGERPLSEKRLRMLNEVPGIAAAIIAILMIVRPCTRSSRRSPVDLIPSRLSGRSNPVPHGRPLPPPHAFATVTPQTEAVSA